MTRLKFMLWRWGFLRYCPSAGCGRVAEVRFWRLNLRLHSRRRWLELDIHG